MTVEVIYDYDKVKKGILESYLNHRSKRLKLPPVNVMLVCRNYKINSLQTKSNKTKLDCECIHFGFFECPHPCYFYCNKVKTVNDLYAKILKCEDKEWAVKHMQSEEGNVKQLAKIIVKDGIKWETTK